MEQNHELPSSFQETERCFYVCRSGCGRIAFRHRYSPNALFCAYFLFYQCDAKLQTVQWHGGEYDESRRTRSHCRIPGRRRGEGRGRASRCFTEDGTIHDEGRDYRGRDAIRQWKQAADQKYRYVLQMVNAQTHGNDVTVRARLTGEFPGSPVELDHIFKLSNNKIASLEIRS